MKKIFICCMLILGTAMFSQTNSSPGNLSPDGMFESVFDQYGKVYKLSDLAVVDTNTQFMKATNPTPLNYGYFNLYLEDGCGLTTTDPDYVNRRAVIGKVLTDLSAFINSPLSTPGNTAKVNIWVRKISNVIVFPNSPAGVLGLATSFYTMPYKNSTGFGGIVDNEVWKTIHNGKDSFTGVISPLSTNVVSSNATGAFYHGMMSFNFTDSSITWNTSLTSTLAFPNDYDLYSVVLHEMTHALGFASLMDQNGLSWFSPGYNYYSRYDNFLRINAGTTKLLTNGSACSSMYNYVFNSPAVLPAVLRPSCTISGNVNTGNSTGQTNCSQAIKFVGISTVPVYTPVCFEIGSSLSHFEDFCVSPNVNNGYFVMSDANGKNIRKRYPKPEERNALADLGYSVNTSFGVGTTYMGSTTYSGGILTGVSVAGMNDGINTNGTYKYIGLATSANPITINSSTDTTKRILSNDIGYTGFECLQDVYDTTARFNGTTLTSVTSLTNGNIDVTFNSAIVGLHLLRYVPVNGSQKGNITYIYVYVTGNCSSANSCNLISNGGFENSLNCGEAYLNNGAPLPVIDCWTYICQSPDLYKRNCTSRNGIYNVNTNTSYNNSPVDSHSSSNDNFIGLYRSGYSFIEGSQGQLSSQLIPNQTYQLSFWARVGNSRTDAGVAIPVNFSSIPNLMPAVNIGSSTFAAVVPASQSIAPTTLVPNDNQWHQYTYNFTFSNTNPHNAIAVYTGTSSSLTSYVFVDDVNIITLNGGSFTLPANLCVNTTSLPNLNAYLNGIPTGGVFAGPGVSGNTLNDLFDMSPGIATISYTYTSSSGCSVTIYSNINVVAPITPGISGSTSAYPTAPNNTTTNTTTIPAGYTAVWSITGGTGVFSTATNLATVGVTWSALPGYLTLTFTNTASGCTSTATKTIYNLKACDCLNTLSYTFTRSDRTITITSTNSDPTCTGVNSGGNPRTNFNYGDGTTGIFSLHTYAAPGNYTVTINPRILGEYDQGICPNGPTYNVSVVIPTDCKGCRYANQNEITIYPNPVSSILNFEVSVKINSPFEVVIRSIDGKELLRKNWNLNKGQQDLQIELPNNISDGMIFVELVSDVINETRTVLIKK